VEFIKLDLSDVDEPVWSVHEAESLDALLDAEAEKYRQDDRLSPCYGYRTAECVSRDHNSIQWNPGNGGGYTIAAYAPNTPEDSEELTLNWLGE